MVSLYRVLPLHMDRVLVFAECRQCLCFFCWFLQSIVSACVSSVGFCKVSSVLVFLLLVFAEYRQCLCFFCWFLQSIVIACVSHVGFRGFMVISQCFSAQLFVAVQFVVHAEHAHRVFRWSWSAAS